MRGFLRRCRPPPPNDLLAGAKGGEEETCDPAGAGAGAGDDDAVGTPRCGDGGDCGEDESEGYGNDTVQNGAPHLRAKILKM